MEEVFIVDGSRTAFIRSQDNMHLAATDLAVAALQPLLARHSGLEQHIDELVAGCVIPAASEANIARLIALRIGCPISMPAWTVQRNCASGLQAIDAAFQQIAMQREHIVLAGGVEAMSRAPVLINHDLVFWFNSFLKSKHWLERLRSLSSLQLSWLKPVWGLLAGLTDPIVNLNMGQTAEQLADEFAITRTMMDAFALQSHQRATAAQLAGHFADVVPLFDWHGKVFPNDNGVRTENSLEKLAKLSPVFKRNFGRVTAGNSSQISDGAAFLLLASRTAVQKHKLPVLAKIRAITWAGVEPARMGFGPVIAIQKLLEQQKIKAAEVDFWEINEAFAAQVLACLAGFEKQGVSIPQEKLNVDGGAIALGHPLGASGARLVWQLTGILRRNSAKLGIASLCIGGGQGGAILLEHISKGI
jgi:acetyl-CoA C-acetyltransferase